METKTCSHCKTLQPLDNFDKKRTNKDGLQRYCKTCRKEIAAKYYKTSKDKIVQTALERRRSTAAELARYKNTLACSRCGEDHIACLDFHHTDPSEKETSVGEAVTRGWSWSRILSEIAKCIIVCRNCHAKLHYGEENHRSVV